MNRYELLTQLMSFVNEGSAAESESECLAEAMVGKYVICRTVNEGINAGVVKAVSRDGVILEQARRLWYHRPKDNALTWYEGVAISGLSDDSKISAAVDLKVIMEKYSLTPCTDAARESIESAVAHEQS